MLVTSRFTIRRDLITAPDEALTRLTGLSREELSNSDGRLFIRGADRDQYISAITQTRRDGAATARLHIITRSGNSLPVRLQLTAQDGAEPPQLSASIHWENTHPSVLPEALPAADMPAEGTASSGETTTAPMLDAVGNNADSESGSPERLARLLDMARVAVITMDVFGMVTYWNRGAERILGWTTEEVTGSFILSFFKYESDVPTPRFADLLHLGYWEGDLAVVARGGRIVILECHAEVERSSVGSAIGILLVYSDVTEYRRNEKRREADRRLEYLALLAGGVAHDLNNVLTPILTGVSLLRLDEQNPDRLLLIHAIESSAQRGAAMLRTLLNSAHPRTTAPEIDTLGAVLSELENYCRATYPGRMMLTLDTSDRDRSLPGTRDDVLRILINLVDNADAAMAARGVVKLTTRTSADDGLLLSVTDTGTGMTPDILDRLFEPFFTTKGPGWGNGLGLAASRTIARSFGGDLVVTTDPGSGSTFTLHLPAPNKTGSSPASVDQVAASKLRPRQAVIMLVDSDPASMHPTREALEDANFDVVGCRSINSAQRWMTRLRHVDLVLTDEQLRTQLADRLGLSFDATPILTTTTRPDSTNGEPHMLLKPFTDAQLVDAVQDALRL